MIDLQWQPPEFWLQSCDLGHLGFLSWALSGGGDGRFDEWVVEQTQVVQAEVVVADSW